MTLNEVSSSATFITQTNQAMWSLLTNTIPHDRMIMCMMTPAGASKMPIPHFTKIFDLGKNGLQLTDDFVTKLKDEFASKDPSVVSSYVPFLDDDMERLVEMCSLEMYLLHSMNLNDKVDIIADTRLTQRWSEHEVDPVLCNRGSCFLLTLSRDLGKFASLGERAHAWYSTKCGRSGNSRICRHLLCDCLGAQLDTMCSSVFHKCGRRSS